MKQQFENMLCVLSPLMWPKMKRMGASEGRRTGLRGHAYSLWNHQSEIHFIYAGFHKLDGADGDAAAGKKKKRVKSKVNVALDDLGGGGEAAAALAALTDDRTR